MFSLDLVRWRQAKDEHLAHFQKKFTPPQAQEQEKHVKNIYGKTPKEMHVNYLERVNIWMTQAPSKDWTKLYSKELDHTKTNHSPFRDRRKSKEIGDPMMHTGKYIPRGIFTGGGVCVSIKENKKGDVDVLPPLHDVYQPPIQEFQRTREKHKEIQPPMSIPKNKTLEVAHYFVQDIVSSSISKSTPTLAPLSSGRRQKKEPSSHQQHQWMDKKAFTSIIKSQNLYTAKFKGLGGNFFQPSILSSDPYPKTPGEAILNDEQHPSPRTTGSRKFLLAPLSSLKYRQKQKQQQQIGEKEDEEEKEKREKKYFNSMLTNGSSSLQQLLIQYPPKK